MVLLKYFDKELKEEWHREADIVQGLSYSGEPHANLLHYRWHSKGNQPSTHGQKFRTFEPARVSAVSDQKMEKSITKMADRNSRKQLR